MKDLGHWVCNTEIPENPYGFVYCITNTVCQRRYIGKKQILSILKRPPLKGKTKRRWEVVETDWKHYTSSSRDVNQDIETLGKDKFVFEILRFCCSKSELAYYEAKEQFDREVLLREDYYNGIINLRIGKIKKSTKS